MKQFTNSITFTIILYGLFYFIMYKLTGFEFAMSFALGAITADVQFLKEALRNLKK